MAVVGYATIQLIPSIEGFSSKVNEQIGAPLEQAGKSGGSKAGGLFGSSFFTSVGHILASAAIYQVGSSIGSGIGLGIKTGLQQAAFMQSAEQSFTTLLGSGGQAQQMLSQLSTFAAHTPFDVPGAVSAAQKLLGAGEAAKGVLPALTSLGDANAAVGASQDQFNDSMLAWTQIMSRGKLDTQDLYQLSNAGIPIWKELSKAIDQPTTSVMGMVSAGKLASDDVLPKLQAQLEKDYGGAMAKQATTLGGVWGTVTDTIKQSLGQAFLPLAPVLAATLPGAAQVAGNAILGLSHGIAAVAGFFKTLVESPAIQSFGTAIKATLLTAGAAVAPSMAMIGDGFKGIAPILGSVLPLFTPFTTIFKALLPLVPPLAGALAQLAAGAMPIIESVLTSLVPIAQAFVNTVTSLAQIALPILEEGLAVVEPLLGSFLSAFEALAQGPLQAVFTAVGQVANQIGSALITALSTLVTTLLPPLSDLFQQLAPVVLNVITALMPLAQVIVSQLVPAFMQIITTLLPPLMSLFQALVPILMLIIPPIAQIVVTIVSTLVPVIKALMPLISTIVSAIVAVIKPLATIIAGVINVIVGLLTGNWAQAWKGAKQIVSGVWDAIKAVVTGAISILVAAIRAGVSLIGTLWSAGWKVLSTALGAVWKGITTVVSNGWKTVTGIIGHAKDDIVGVFAGAGSWLLSSGKALIGGFVQGIKNMAGEAASAAKHVVSAVANFFPHSPAPEGPFSGKGWTLYSGMSLVDGFSDGIAARQSSLAKTMADTFVTPSLAMSDVSAVSGDGLVGATAAAATSSTSSASPYIGTVNFEGSGETSSDIEELNFYLRHKARGGR